MRYICRTRLAIYSVHALHCQLHIPMRNRWRGNRLQATDVPPAVYRSMMGAPAAARRIVGRLCSAFSTRLANALAALTQV
jgi:hypothetical protein